MLQYVAGRAASPGLRLLVVTNDFPPRIGGIEEYVAELVRHLSSRISATVITSNHRDSAAFDRRFPARVIRWGRYPLLPTPALAGSIAEHASENQIDVVLFGAALPLALIAGAVRRRTHAALLAFTHGLEPAVTQVPGGARLMRRVLEHVTVTTVLSRWAEQRLRSAVGPGQRIELLRSGVDGERFHPGVDGALIRRRFGLEAAPVIVSVARLVPRKGHDRLIEALPAIARDVPGVKLLIVGSGPGRTKLERLATRCRVASHVVFAGAVPDHELPACFAAGDLFAMPCRTRWAGLDTEGLGTVFLQAAAVGKAAIAGRSGGAPEAVIDGETGVVVDGRSPDEVAAGISRLLRQADECRALGDRGARRVHRELTWPILAHRLEELIEFAAAGRRIRPPAPRDSRTRSGNTHLRERSAGSADDADRARSSSEGAPPQSPQTW